MLIEGLVGNIPNQSLSDGNSYRALLGKSAEQVMTPLHGKYYTLNYRGRVFTGATATGGTTIPLSNTTAPTCGIWNPAGSGVNVVPIKCQLGYVTGTGIAGALGYSYATGLGSQIGTASPVPAFVKVTPTNCNLGSGAPSLINFCAGGTNTLTAAGALARYFGVSQGAPITTTAQMYPGLVDDFDGNIIIAPGAFLYLVCVNQAVAVTWAISWVWAEVPV